MNIKRTPKAPTRIDWNGKLSEADVTRQIRDLLKLHRVFHWKNWSGPMTYPKGISDILGCHKGRLFAIEVKAEGWKAPGPALKSYRHYKEQEDFLFQVRSSGGIGFFAQSVEEVQRGLDLRFGDVAPLFGGGKWDKQDQGDHLSNENRRR